MSQYVTFLAPIANYAATVLCKLAVLFWIFFVAFVETVWRYYWLDALLASVLLGYCVYVRSVRYRHRNVLCALAKSGLHDEVVAQLVTREFPLLFRISFEVVALRACGLPAFSSALVRACAAASASSWEILDGADILLREMVEHSPPSASRRAAACSRVQTVLRHNDAPTAASLAVWALQTVTFVRLIRAFGWRTLSAAEEHSICVVALDIAELCGIAAPRTLFHSIVAIELYADAVMCSSPSVESPHRLHPIRPGLCFAKGCHNVVAYTLLRRVVAERWFAFSPLFPPPLTGGAAEPRWASSVAEHFLDALVDPALDGLISASRAPRSDGRSRGCLHAIRAAVLTTFDAHPDDTLSLPGPDYTALQDIRRNNVAKCASKSLVPSLVGLATLRTVLLFIALVTKHVAMPRQRPVRRTVQSCVLTRASSALLSDDSSAFDAANTQIDALAVAPAASQATADSTTDTDLPPDKADPDCSIHPVISSSENAEYESDLATQFISQRECQPSLSDAEAVGRSTTNTLSDAEAVGRSTTNIAGTSTPHVVANDGKNASPLSSLLPLLFHPYKPTTIAAAWAISIVAGKKNTTTNISPALLRDMCGSVPFYLHGYEIANLLKAFTPPEPMSRSRKFMNAFRRRNGTNYDYPIQSGSLGRASVTSSTTRSTYKTNANTTASSTSTSGVKSTRGTICTSGSVSGSGEKKFPPFRSTNPPVTASRADAKGTSEASVLRQRVASIFKLNFLRKAESAEF